MIAWNKFQVLSILIWILVIQLSYADEGIIDAVRASDVQVLFGFIKIRECMIFVCV